MKIRITKREKNMLVILAGLLLVLLAYFYGYRILSEKTESIRRQNAVLNSQVQTLEMISQSKEQFISETELMQKDMEELMGSFPSDLIAEDIILYIKKLEQETDSYVHNVTTPSKEYVDITASVQEDVLGSFEDITGAIRDYGFINDGRIPDTSVMQFAQVESEVSCSVSYQGLKEIIADITGSEDRKSIDNVSLVFNENTGDLAGSMTVTYYTLSGTGREYSKPSISGTAFGVDCIFGELRTGADNGDGR